MTALADRQSDRQDDQVAALEGIGRRARAAARLLAKASAAAKDAALQAAATELRERRPALLAANARDLAEHGDGLTSAQRDRLLLDDKRVEGMAAGLETVAAMP